MPVPASMDDLSTTPSSNSPAGSENPATTDDYHRAIQAILRHTNAKGTDIASNTTIDLGAATGEFVDVTGTTTITSLGTIASGIVRTVRFTGALTLTHNATSLILPTGANITTAANEVAMFRSLGSGNWLCINYMKADGRALTGFNGGTISADITMSGAMDKWAKGADVASATALPLITDGNYFDVTGTTTITSFDSVGVGSVVKLHFDDALTLTHHATNLILPTGADITTAAGDEAEFVEYGSGVFRCTSYSKASGEPLVVNQTITSATAQSTTSGTSKDFTSIPSTVKRITVMFSGVSTNGSSIPIIQLGDSGGVEASGYLGSTWEANTANTSQNTGFNLHAIGVASKAIHGLITLSLLDASTNTWVASGNLSSSASSVSINVSGSKSLSDTLDTVRLTTVNGTDAFDAGSVNILYE